MAAGSFHKVMVTSGLWDKIKSGAKKAWAGARRIGGKVLNFARNVGATALEGIGALAGGAAMAG